MKVKEQKRKKEKKNTKERTTIKCRKQEKEIYKIREKSK